MNYTYVSLRLEIRLLVWPFSELQFSYLTTALRTSWISSVTSHAQRALSTIQWSWRYARPIKDLLTLASLPAVRKRFAPSCRLTEQPLITIDCLSVLITTADQSWTLSLPKLSYSPFIPEKLRVHTQLPRFILSYR